MLDELERLAREATPGPWESWTDCPGACCWLIRRVNTERESWESMDGADGVTWPETSRENAAYIAAANPSTVLKLIAVARAAQRYFDGYCQDEAIDGEYVSQGQCGPLTGCGYAQATDALDLRTSLEALKEPT